MTERHVPIRVRNHPGERRRRAEILVIGVTEPLRHRALARRIEGRAPDSFHGIGVAYMVGRTEEQAIDRAVHRGVRADPERKGEDDASREAGGTLDSTAREPHGLEYALEAAA